MMSSGAVDGGGELNASVARGGPIYVPNLVGPLTTVPGFESALLHELQELKAELCDDSSALFTDDDISVDELKVFSDEDLVEMALKETMKDERKNGSSLQQSQKHSDTRKDNDLSLLSNGNLHLESSGRRGDASADLELINDENNCNRASALRKRKRSLKSSERSHAGTCSSGTTIDNNSRKEKGRQANKLAVDGCLVKVDEILTIKQKQDQDRVAAKLHSLNCKINKTAITSLEKTERMKYLRFTDSGKQLKPSNVQEHISVKHPEVVLCIEVYHNIHHCTKTQEFLVLGRQALTEMRDKIYCMTDQVMQKAGQHDPSGYFLIEDTFCNDMRDQSAIDCSEPIFDWLNNDKDKALKKWECIINGELLRKQKAVIGEARASHLPQFRRVDMQGTRFCDLRFRLGAGYLYCHQGDCKHTIVIRDMRLIHPEDIQNRSAYPITMFQPKFRVKKCKVCKIFRATKVTVDDKWTSYNPCYFCDYCYYLLHYSENGSLLYTDFTTYDYLHD